MKRMKLWKNTAALLLLVCLLVSCAGAEEINLGALKGPTVMGMAQMLTDPETVSGYSVTLAGSADELTPKFIRGEIDIMAVPINLGAVLYNKTKGNVQLLAVCTLGVMSILENGEGIRSVADLKGKTLYATGKGSAPEYSLRYLLGAAGLDADRDLSIVWKSEPAESVAALLLDADACAMVPQPYVTVALSANAGMREALNLNEEWNKTDTDSMYITAGIIARKDFVLQHPEAVTSFMEEYRQSVEFVNTAVSEAAVMVDALGIIKAPVAEKAIPACGIVDLEGAEMRTAAEGYLTILYEQNPASVGGAMPGADFYGQ